MLVRPLENRQTSLCQRKHLLEFALPAGDVQPTHKGKNGKSAQPPCKELVKRRNTRDAGSERRAREEACPSTASSGPVEAVQLDGLAVRLGAFSWAQPFSVFSLFRRGPLNWSNGIGHKAANAERLENMVRNIRNLHTCIHR